MSLFFKDENIRSVYYMEDDEGKAQLWQNGMLQFKHSVCFTPLTNSRCILEDHPSERLHGCLFYRQY